MRYYVRCYVEKTMTAWVDAESEKEAIEIAREWHNLHDEETEFEQINDTEIIGVD